MNKLYGEPVTENDVRELGALIPTLGRIITTISHVREIENISSAIQMGMYTLKDSITSKLESVGQDELLGLESAVKQVEQRVDLLMESKRQALVTNKALSGDVLKYIRIVSAQNVKK